MTEQEMINHLLQFEGGCLSVPCGECPFCEKPERSSPSDCQIEKESYSTRGRINRFLFAQNYTAMKIKDLLDIL